MDCERGAADRTNARKRKLGGEAGAAAAAVRQRAGSTGIGDPRTVATWNANGLAPRCSGGRIHELSRLVNMTRNPDVILVQEARLKAADGPPSYGGREGGGWRDRSRPSPSEYGAVKCCFRGGGKARPPFGEYESLWSLSDKRYAGTLTLVRRDLFSSSPSGVGSWEEWKDQNAAFSFDGAMEMMMDAYGGVVDRDEVGYEPTEDASTCVEKTSASSGGGNKRSPGGKRDNGSNGGPRQSSMSAFLSLHSSKPKEKKRKSSESTDDARRRRRRAHHVEGRVQYLRFPTLDVLHTYVPNNGTREDQFARRRDWDGRVRRFLEARSRVLAAAGDAGRPLLWAGDLNVGRDYRDGTHWSRAAGGGGEGAAAVREWWTDESKCLRGGGGETHKRPEDRGMPSFTPAERSRFQEALASADLVDVWRELHPHGVSERRCPVIGGGGGLDEPDPWARAEWTWRGQARYGGKAQRLDYFLLSAGAYRAGLVESCDILGYGVNREGLFCGSDHCASLLVLKERQSSK